MTEPALEAVWRALEASPPAEALKASFIAYPVVNALHVMSIGAVVTSVLFLDLRTLGAWPGIARDAFVGLMRRVALLAFAAAVLSGALLFAVRAGEYAANPAFLLKMGLIALAGLNFLLLARGGRSPAEALMTKLAAALSLVLWPATLLAGRFIGFLG